MIFEKIRERLQEKVTRYEGNAKGQCCEDYKWLEEASAQATEEAIDIINQVEAEYNNGWIKCGDEPLAVGCKYLVVDKDNDIYIATYLNDNVFIARDKNYFMPIRIEATYCQLLPLPQPPKGE